MNSPRCLPWLGVTLAMVAALGLQGCELAVLGAAGSAAYSIAEDRRTSGTQFDDETIQPRTQSRVSDRFGDKVHLTVTSFNRMALLTGEAPDQGLWASIGGIAKNTEKVRAVNNELVVGPNTDLSARSNDTYITSKVKSRMIEANKFPPNAVKVVTERGVVYLMGIVSTEEGAAAGETAATTAGVVRVVKLFQYKT